MNAVLDAYEAIRLEIEREDRAGKDTHPYMGLYKMEPVYFSITTRTVNQAEAEQALAAFPAQQGWVCRQSSLNVFDHPNDRPDPTEGGVLLSAELVATDDQRSLHLRQNGAGAWLLSELCEGTAVNQAKAVDGLAHSVDLIGNSSVARKDLSYRVYWRHDADHGWQTCASRLHRTRRPAKSSKES